MLRDIFDLSVFDTLGIDREIVNQFDIWMKQSEEKRIADANAAWEEQRKSFKWILEPFNKTDEFNKKYQNSDYNNFYILKNTEDNTYMVLFRVGINEVKDYEKKLNSQRYVELHKFYEDIYSDEIMESCHGKNWKVKDEKTGKPVTPYYLGDYSVIFDTKLGSIIYETEKERYHHTYIKFFDNVAEIIQERNKTVYFDLPNRKILVEGNYDKIESNDYIILGKSHYYNNEREKATIINKHTCEVTTIN